MHARSFPYTGQTLACVISLVVISVINTLKMFNMLGLSALLTARILLCCYQSWNSLLPLLFTVV
jgi:hypothetical protein